jgi:uncharacterized membrane protein
MRILVSFPIACFCCAFLTDLAYVATADMMWADFSDWLLAFGMIMGGLAAVAGIVSLFRRRTSPVRRPIVPLALGGIVVLALGFLNNLVHSRDAWTSVVPQGIVLSGVTVLVILLTAWRSSAPIYRYDPVLLNTGVRP